MRKRIRFLKEFVMHPRSTGAVTPSSRFLTRRLVRDANIGPGATVAEYGPGTGATTRRIIEQLDKFRDSDRPHFFAIEINDDFADGLRRRHPGLPVHVGCASRVAEFLELEGRDQLDAVISGLPWSVLPADLQDRLLTSMVEAMSPGAYFTTFAYVQGLMLPSGRRFKQKLGEMFSEVNISPVVWRNIPPAVVYQCRKAGG